MTVYLVGIPGLQPRLAVENERAASAVQAEGEVIVEVEAIGEYVIADDGEGVGPFVQPVEVRRETRWAEARAYREAYAAAGCATPLGRVDTDNASRQKISGAVQMAMIALSAGETFSIDWTMSDNSIVTHDAATMIAMGVAVGRFVNACQEASVAIRAAIEASDDPATVPIDVGYPA